MSAGLDASTVTPGSTPPDVSCTSPEMLAWAAASLGKATTAKPMTRILETSRHICALLARSLVRASVPLVSVFGSEPGLDRDSQEPGLQDRRRLSERRSNRVVLALDVARIGEVEQIELPGVLHFPDPENLSHAEIELVLARVVSRAGRDEIDKVAGRRQARNDQRARRARPLAVGSGAPG